METVLFMLDALAVAALVFTSLRNDKLRGDQQPTGPFAFIIGQSKRRGSKDAGSGRRNDPTSRSAALRK